MIFYTSFCEPRPIRLCEETRRFAYESLYEHTYGKDALRVPAVSLDGIENWDQLSELDRYDAAIEAIAERAPVRICNGERISGAATLGMAIRHLVPATYNGESVCQSVSHLTLDFPKVLRVGINGIRQEVEAAYAAHTDPQKRRFLESCRRCLNAFGVWHGRYIEALTAAGYTQNAEILRRVPLAPPRHFHEAVQSLWFTFAFVRLCGNWPGIGRIDEMLGDYLKRDLDAGVLTVEEAREILAHFFIKGCEWITGEPVPSGDAQHYQNLVLAGVNADGEEVTNPVSYLVLDVVEELGIADFPITVRMNAHTDPTFLRRVAEVMRYGNGILAIYNEDLILQSLTAFGYPLKEARSFANDGCWEIQIPGKTLFSYHPFDALALLQHRVLEDYAATVDFDSFEVLYEAYMTALKRQVEELCTWVTGECLIKEAGGWRFKEGMPCTVVSLFEEGCIQKGLAYFSGGPVYCVRSPHIGGLADAVNSLYAIKKLVFEEKKLSFAAFMAVLRENWEGHDELLRYVRQHYVYYGNDSDEVDGLAASVLNAFADATLAQNDGRPIFFVPGVSTFGRQIDWLPDRLASPHGRKRGEILAGNCSPTPGTTTEGATAIIRSYCKADMKKQVNGAALDIRLLPADVKEERGLCALEALIGGFVALGGSFMQIDVADAAVLREAQKHPEDYRALSVRISGWNARFVTLSREWQEMVIQNIGE